MSNIFTTSEREIAIDWLKGILREQTVRVKFLKADGSERVLHCTLKEGVAIPHTKTTEREKKQNDNVMPVWDVENNAWRSFRLDSVISIEFDIGASE